MPKFAANLSMMFQEIGFLDRFEAAARAGFKAVEFLFPYDHPAAVIAERLERHGLSLALFNTVPGDWAGGERGLAALPGREREFRDGVDRAIVYAKATKCPLLHLMAGLWPPAKDQLNRDRADGERVYLDNLRWAAERVGAAELTAVIEPINTRDIPGYFLNYTGQAMRIIEQAGRPNLKLQLDLYHLQIMEGDLATRIRALAGAFPHVQIAGNPGRHEPDVGEINYPYLFDLLDEIGYRGWIGCEYRPKGDTLAGLGWAGRYGIGRTG
jgi:hydroxypyruvate isomerase